MNLNHDLNLEIGTKVLIDLGKESFIGDIHSINKSRTRIQLINVEDFQTKTKHNGIQYYYSCNIKSITPIPNQAGLVKNSSSSSSSNAGDSESSDFHTKTDDYKIILSKNQLNDLHNSLENIKLLIQTDTTYFNAIEDLNSQREFVILGEDCKFGRNRNASILTCYSPTTKIVYIFDMMCLQKIPKEFKIILEANEPRKIMFDSKALCDHLKYVLDVDNIDILLDVLVLYFLSKENHESTELIPCIQKYFSLPENYFTIEKNISWTTRPLSKENIRFTAKKAIFLFLLYDHLLHNNILNKIYAVCKNYSSTFKDTEDRVEVARLMATNDRSADHLVKSSGTEIIDEMTNRLNGIVSSFD